MRDEPEPSWMLTKVTAISGAALVVAAGAHRLMFGGATYTTSILVQVELGLLIVLVLILGEQPLESIVHLVKRRWKALRRNALTVVLAIASLLLALGIDPATLLYAT